MIKLLDRYVFWEWLKVFAISLGVILGILVLHNMYSTLDDLLRYGAGAGRIVFFYALIAPSFIPLVLPISLLLSLIFVLGALHKNNEITAMRAAGMNIFKITRSLWLAGFLLAGLLFWINSTVVPHSVEKSKLMMEQLELEYRKEKAPSQAGKIERLEFFNKKDRRLWLINSFNVATNAANEVFVYTLDEKSRERSKIIAREAVYDDVDKCWFFRDGQEIFFDEETGRPIRTLLFHSEGKFDGASKRVYEDFNEKPEIMRLSMKRTKDLSLFQVKELINYSTQEGGEDYDKLREYRVKYFGMWFSPVICLIVVVIAIPFSVAGVRTNPMVGVSKTVAMFFAYYIADNIFTVLGARGMLPPLLAVAMPALVMLLCAIPLYRKAI